jgi:zinc protease
MRPLRPLVFLLLLAQWLGCATPRAPSRAPYEGYLGTFASGMRLVVYGYAERGGAAALHVSYRLGVEDEPAGQEGIRELALQLSALGRPEGPGTPTLLERFQAGGAGGLWGESADEVYFTTLNSTIQLPRLLELEAARMREPLANVTEAEFLAVREALARGLEAHSPDAAPDVQMREALFAGHPYGRPVAGKASSVRSLTLEAVQAWARRHFTPDRAVLVVMGGLSPKEVAAAATATFGPLTVGPAARPYQATPPPPPHLLPPGCLI